MSIGKNLRTLRGDIPRKTVASACGISVSALMMYETDNRIPRDWIKKKLSEFYGTSVESIFFNGGDTVSVEERTK